MLLLQLLPAYPRTLSHLILDKIWSVRVPSGPTAVASNVVQAKGKLTCTTKAHRHDAAVQT